MAIYKEDLVNIELETGSIHRSFLSHTIGSGDSLANRYGVRLFRNGEPVSAESSSVTGIFMAPDGMKYAITETSYPGSTGTDENAAWVQLPPICYAVTGQFCLAIKLSGGSVEGTMRIVDGIVSDTGEAGAVVPTSTIPTTADIIAAYEEAIAVMGGSVRFDAEQSLSDSEKETARGNIEAAGLDQVVRSDAEQSLSTAEQETARTNIGAESREEIIQNIRHPLVAKSGDAECALPYAEAVLSMWFEFESVTDEDAFWNGSHTYEEITTAKRNIGLSYVENGASIRFYWFDDNGEFIGTDFAFAVVGYQDIVLIADSSSDIRYHRIKTTLDGYDVTIHIVVNWSAVQAVADYTNVFNDRFMSEYNKLYGSLFTFNTGYNFWRSPIKTNSATQKSVVLDIIKATKGVLFEFDSQSDEDAFWSGNHTYESTTAVRNLAPTVYNIEDGKKYFAWYWVDDTNTYIVGDRAFVCREGVSVLYKIGNISVHRLSATLDGYNCRIYIAINWDEIQAVSSAKATSVFYDKTAIAYQKILFAFSGVGSGSSSNFSNINFGVDGDSITAGDQWSYIVANKLGYNTHHNVAVGSSTFQDKLVEYNGTTYKPQIYGDPDWVGMSAGYDEITDATEAQKRANNCSKNHVLKFIDEVDGGFYPEPDIFVFAMGTNDQTNRLGTVEAAFASAEPLDVDDPLLETTIGAMRWCIQKIKTEYPDCKILWSTPIQSTADSRNSGNDTKVPVMTEAAKLLSVQIIDQRNNSGISAIMEKANAHYLRDGVHPTDDGRAVMAQFAASVLGNMMKQ